MGLFKYPGAPQPQVPSQGQAAQSPLAQQTPFLNFNDDEKDDLIRYQLDLSKTKSDIAHWLNGDTPKIENGKEIWDINNDEKSKVLNDFGVKEIMRIINMYLTKDVIMSSLSEVMINRIAQDIATELNDLFFTKHDEIGLDTSSKRKNYSTIILPVIHIIYITLKRAEGGEERKGITETRNIIESFVSSQTPQRGNLLHPFSFGRKK